MRKELHPMYWFFCGGCVVVLIATIVVRYMVRPLVSRVIDLELSEMDRSFRERIDALSEKKSPAEQSE